MPNGKDERLKEPYPVVASETAGFSTGQPGVRACAGCAS